MMNERFVKKTRDLMTETVMGMVLSSRGSSKTKILSLLVVVPLPAIFLILLILDE